MALNGRDRWEIPALAGLSLLWRVSAVYGAYQLVRALSAILSRFSGLMVVRLTSRGYTAGFMCPNQLPG